MAASKEAIVICLDVGPHMRLRDDETSPTALEQALECINWIFLRKIFTESKDEFAIILFGTADTDNPLASGDDGDYTNICVMQELQIPKWDMVKYIQNEIPPPGAAVSTDFVDAIVVSLDLLCRTTEGKKYLAKQIVLFSNLGSPFADDQVDKISDAIKNSGTELILFGPRLHLHDEVDDHNGHHNESGAGNLKKTAQQELGERYIAKILNRVGGQSYSFKEGLSLLSKFTMRTVRPTPWKCNLELGEKIKIPVCVYVKTKKAKNKQSWKWAHAQDPNAEITVQRTYHKRDEGEDAHEEPETSTQAPSTKPKYPERDDAVDNEDEDSQPTPRLPIGRELEKQDLIKVFNYGATAVPLDKMDLEAMKYKNPEKCLKILSFIVANQAKRQYFMGDGCYMVFSEAGDEEGSTAFLALWKVMRQEGRAALVRYAYRAGSAPRLGVLIPTTEGDAAQGHHAECFMYVAFPFAEDCRMYEFPSLDDVKAEPSTEQLNIIDDLITSMDLTSALVDETGRRCEAYNPSTVVDPHLQNTFASLAHRALYENQPLPPVNRQLVASISPLEQRLQLTKPVFEQMRRAFDLKKREEKKGKRTANDIFQEGASSAGIPSSKLPRHLAPSVDADISVKISSVRPVEEYAAAVDRDENAFEDANARLQMIIAQFIFDAVDNQFYEKAADCVDVYRRKAIQLSKPGVFNQWIRDLKRRLVAGGKDEFLLKLSNRQLGLVTDEECASSFVSTDDAKAFFEEDEKPAIKEEPVPVAEASDLLDELE